LLARLRLVGEHDKHLVAVAATDKELAMAEQDPNFSDTPAAGPTGPRWRPNATIELKADEVRAEPATESTVGAAPEPPPAAARGSTDADAVSSPEAVATGLSAAAATPEAPAPRGIHPDASMSPPPPPTRGGSPWSHIGAGAVGAALMGAGLAALWLTGLVTPSDSSAEAGRAQIAEVAARLNADAGAKMTTLANRLTKLEQTAGAAATASGVDARLADRLAATERAAKSLSGEVAELRRRADENAAQGAQGSLRGIERRDLDDLTGRLAKLEAGAQAELAKQNAALASAGAMHYAVAALALRAAVDEGVPFKHELTIVKSLAPASVSLAPLERFAAGGVPRIQALSRELIELAPAMLRAAGAAPKEGFLDRLQANAERLVRIRRIEEAPGDDPVAIIGRIEIKAGRPDVADTLAEFAKLPPAVRAPAEGWIKRAQTRQEAIDLSRRLQADALNALGKD
jgi:hypothetical protein